MTLGVHTPSACVHSGTAHRSDPEKRIDAAAGIVAEVVGLSVPLCLPPCQLFTIEATASLYLTMVEGTVELAFVLEGTRCHTQSPWQALTARELSLGMIRVTHAFSSISGTGEPCTVHLAIRPQNGLATYSVGVLSAMAIPSAGVVWTPGVGPTSPLAVSPPLVN